MKLEVFYPIRYLNNEELTSFDKIMLCYLLRFYTAKTEFNYINIPVLYHRVYNESYFKASRRQQNTFKENVDSLINKLLKEDLIEIEGEEQGTYIVTRLEKCENETFITINLDDVNKILRETNQFALAYYYVLLMKSRNFTLNIMDKKGAVGYMPVNYFSEILNKSPLTIMNYNKRLEDMQIIYIRHSQKQGIPNAYGLYEDKKRIDHYYSNYYTFNITKTTNRRRSLMQKYNNAIRKGIKYSKKEINEINEYIKQRNKAEQSDEFPLLPL